MSNALRAEGDYFLGYDKPTNNVTMGRSTAPAATPPETRSSRCVRVLRAQVRELSTRTIQNTFPLYTSRSIQNTLAYTEDYRKHPTSAAQVRDGSGQTILRQAAGGGAIAGFASLLVRCIFSVAQAINPLLPVSLAVGQSVRAGLSDTDQI